ncbi:MAG: LacI family DNA-binding transcriptional regulator, partial [Propioniciclava sp.]
VEREIIERSLDLVEAVVLASSRMPDASIRMIAKQRPVILLNRSMPDVAHVLIDDARGVQLAAEHLAGLGHRSLLYLRGPETSYADGVRWQALRRVARQLGLQVHRTDPHPEPSISAGIQAAAAVADGGATAVLAYNDALAIGLMKEFKALGISVPGEISVVGFDNVATAQVVDPGLTTIAAPLRAMGATGVRNVLALLKGATSSHQPYILPVTLKVRESTAPPA